jgi:hypothetical protein
MNKFIYFLQKYQNEITWFLVGWCIYAGINALEKESYSLAMFDFFIALVNLISLKCRI